MLPVRTVWPLHKEFLVGPFQISPALPALTEISPSLGRNPDAPVLCGMASTSCLVYTLLSAYLN